MTFLIVYWKQLAMLAAFLAISAYAAVQHIGWQSCRAEFAQFRADTERLGAEAKVKAAQDRAQQAQNAQEALDGLQTRYAALSARYSRLRANPGGGGVPALSSAASVLGACPAGQPDPAARFLAEVESRVTAILEEGDRELTKYRQLWELQRQNSAGQPAH